MDLIPQEGSRAIKIKWVSKKGGVKQTRMLLWPQLRSEEPRLKPGRLTLRKVVWELFVVATRYESDLTLEYLDDEGDWVSLDRGDELDAALLSTTKSRKFLVIAYDQKESADINRVALRKLFEDNKSPDLAEDGKG